jgi:pilus assembly protein Flp/PilA
MTRLLYRFVADDQGQDLIEYAILTGFIALVAVAAITSVGTAVNQVFVNIQSQLTAVPGGS